MQYANASLAAGAWIILTAISLVAAYGFFSLQNQRFESKQLKQSALYLQAVSNVEKADAQVSDFSRYASVDVDALKQSHSDLQNVLSQAKSKLNACPKNWFTKCIRPAEANIKSINDRLSPIVLKIEGHDQYQSAVLHQSNMQTAFENMDSGKAITASVHPVFSNMDNLAEGTSANDLKAFFLLITSIVLELLGSIVYYLKTQLTLNDDTVPHTVNIRSSTPLPKPVAIASTVSNNTVPYIKLEADIVSGKVTNLSFNSLRVWLKEHNVTGAVDNVIKSLRSYCVTEGLAVQDATGKLLITTNQNR
ncbi:secreted protein [Beggiatoa sp. PS]|nr:secreted protein [Beggiatoa sp. PS]